MKVNVMVPKWHTWTLVEWNCALVEAVFFDKSNLSVPVTRIEASGMFLARCVGEPEQNPSTVQRVFTAAFCASAPSIRRRYSSPDVGAAETRRLGYPANFADLYLTLLAASADDSTHGEGNFRNRFIELLQPLSISAPSFSALPMLWQRVEAWSRKRFAEKGDCRVLLLPAVGEYDKLIGYSKRLSFPSYADEMRLANCLYAAHICSDDGFTRVARAVGRVRSSFSPTFQDEFDSFLEQVRKQLLRSAYESPFWRAVLAITWEAEQRVNANEGVYRLLMQTSDPAFPEFYLLADAIGRSFLTDFESRAIPGSRNEYVVLCPDTDGWAIDTLCAAGQDYVRKARLWRMLRRGSLMLVPDSRDNLASDGQHYDGGPACLLIVGAYGKIASDAATALSIRHTYVTLKGRTLWQALIMPSVSSNALSRLSYSLPEEMQPTMSSAWGQGKVWMAGAAWFGQLLLLNPASTPIIRSDKVESGYFEVLDSNGSSVCSGMLSCHGDGFRIAPSHLTNCSAGKKLRLSLTGLADSVSLEIPIGNSFPLLCTAPLADSATWLSDGIHGKLAGAYGCHLGVRAQSVASIPLFTRQSGAVIIKSEDEMLRGLLDWLAEALTLRYQTRSTLSFQELMSHISPASEAAGIPAWRVKRLLFSAGWLLAVRRCTSPHLCVSRAVRTLSILADKTDGRLQIRLAGMFSDSELALVRSHLGPLCNLRSTVGDSYPLGIGVFVADAPSKETVRELVAELGLEELDEAMFGVPISVGADVKAPWMAPVVELPKDGLEIWSASSGGWAAASTLHRKSSVGTLYRLRGSQRFSFWISVHTGYWKTDSLVWAHLLRLAACGQPAGQVAQDNSCRFNSSLPSLPSSLITWWLHWGGGYVGVLATGEIYFCGNAPSGVWEKLHRWFARHENSSSPNDYSTAEARWKSALRISRLRRSAAIKSGEQ